MKKVIITSRYVKNEKTQEIRDCLDRKMISYLEQFDLLPVIMPNFKELQKNGQFQKMESSIPEISSVSWSSIITGKNPGEHGIFGFTDMIPNSYTISFPNYNNLKEKPFWQKIKEKSKER